jgi:N-acetylglucosaminyldiphosphoundecaprenol N-acetyl-beta-D-mannosaminyltransferase
MEKTENQPEEGRATGDNQALVSPQSVEVLGIPIALTDYQNTLDWIDEAIESRHQAYLCVAPVHLVMVALDQSDVGAAVAGADFVVPDGQPLVWALRALGAQGASRVYGPDLMIEACRRASKTGAKMYLFGGRNDGALVQLTLNLRRRFPGLQIVGGHSPPYRPPTAEEESAIVDEINASGADIVWVGTGQPKQELWMAQMRPRLEAPLLIGVGAAFDFHAGLVPQAPALLQEAGLEWAYRLAREPRRLWKRYLRYNPRFVIEFARQLRSRR